MQWVETQLELMRMTTLNEVTERLESISEWKEEGLLTEEEVEALTKLAKLKALDSFSGERWISGGRAGVTVSISFGSQKPS